MGAPWVAAAVSFAVSAVTSIASYYLTTKEVEGPRLDSTNAPSSTYGQEIPIIYGRAKVAGNLIWTKKLREERRDGNKTKGVPTEYLYYGTFAVLLCEGIVDVTKIWANGKLVYDFYSPSGETQIATSKFGQYLKIYKGTSDQQPDPTIQAIEGADRTPAFKGKAYLVFNDLPLKEFNNGIPTIACEVVQSENPLLSEIVSTLCLEAGIPSNKIDTSELTDKVTGLIINNSGESYKDVLDQLAKYFLFYITQDKTGKLLFRKIQRPTVSCTIPFGELGTRDSGNERPENYKKIRLQESELPTSLSINFKNPNLRYNPDTQIALTRKEADNNGVSLDFNLTLYRTEARYIALILLHQFWIRRNRYEELTLSPKWLNAILPGDLIQIPLNETTHSTVQVESIDIGANYQLTLKCVDYDGTSFSPPPIEVDEEIRYDFINDPSSYGSADLFVLDIPIFDGRSKSSGAYAVASSVSANWKNGDLFGSYDNGNSYEIIDSFYSPSAVGICAEALPERRDDVVDYGSELTVTLVNANPTYQLFSSSDISFFNGDVMALVGSEIIAFKNAELIAPLTYKISTFIRGMFGTAVSGHIANEQFILLKGGSAARNVFFPIEVGQALKLKLKTKGELIEYTPVVDFFYTGNLYNCYTPFKIEINYSNLNPQITWRRRTNFTNDTGYVFDISFYNLSGVLKHETTTTLLFLEVPYTDLFYYFPNDEFFLVKIRERNSVKSSEWSEQILPIVPPYLFDEDGNYISDENDNLILY